MRTWGKINHGISFTYLVCINKRSCSVPWHYLSQAAGTKSGVLAGRCPIYNTQHVLALMVWPHSCISLVSAVQLWALWGCVQHGRGLGGGMGYGEHPVLQFWERRGWGWAAASGRIVPEEHGCCSQVWGHLGFMSSLCAQPLLRCWPTSVTPWLFLFALDIAAFPQQQPVNVFLGSKGGWFEHLSVRSCFHIYNIQIEAAVDKCQALPTGSWWGDKLCGCCSTGNKFVTGKLCL